MNYKNVFCTFVRKQMKNLPKLFCGEKKCNVIFNKFYNKPLFFLVSLLDKKTPETNYLLVGSFSTTIMKLHTQYLILKFKKYSCKVCSFVGAQFLQFYRNLFLKYNMFLS